MRAFRLCVGFTQRVANVEETRHVPADSGEKLFARRGWVGGARHEGDVAAILTLVQRSAEDVEVQRVEHLMWPAAVEDADGAVRDARLPFQKLRRINLSILTLHQRVVLLQQLLVPAEVDQTGLTPQVLSD